MLLLQPELGRDREHLLGGAQHLMQLADPRLGERPLPGDEVEDHLVAVERIQARRAAYDSTVTGSKSAAQPGKFGKGR